MKKLKSDKVTTGQTDPATPVLYCPQNKNAGRTIPSNTIETGIWSKSAPHNQFVSFSNLRSFTSAVPTTDASKRQTTPGGTQPSHDIVSDT